MKLHVDKDANALYLRLDDSAIVESEEVSPGMVLDYNASNEVVGVSMNHSLRFMLLHVKLPSLKPQPFFKINMRAKTNEKFWRHLTLL